MKLSTQLLIDGQFVTGDGPAEPILNPTTGELLASVPEASFEQVNRAVADMDKVTQQNSANAEESASAAEQLSAQAVEMKQFITGLAALLGGGRKSAEKPSASGAGDRASIRVSTGPTSPPCSARSCSISRRRIIAPASSIA